jgi:ABC-type lipopolysaccharide export system ATPase subunit
VEVNSRNPGSPVQNAHTLEVANRGYVETGHIALEGSAKELAANEDVKKAYLGIAEPTMA